jgi:hypothetical protein
VRQVHQRLPDLLADSRPVHILQAWVQVESPELHLLRWRMPGGGHDRGAAGDMRDMQAKMCHMWVEQHWVLLDMLIKPILDPGQ